MFETRADASGCHGTAVVLRGFNLRQTSWGRRTDLPGLENRETWGTRLGREPKTQVSVQTKDANLGHQATIVTQPSLWGMAYRISQVNERFLGFIGLIAPTVIHTGVAAATDEGQERRSLANGYASASQQCDPTR